MSTDGHGFEGGQGRTAGEVRGTAWTGCVAFIAAGIVLAAMLAWVMLQ